jgi:hypothetical protein
VFLLERERAAAGGGERKGDWGLPEKGHGERPDQQGRGQESHGADFLFLFFIFFFLFIFMF